MSGTCDLVGVFAEIMRVFGYRARSKAVTIESHIDPAFPALRTASSGEEALKLFAERRPRLVLTDLWMPGMDGVALAAAIRKEGGTMPIVAITADSDARTSFDMSDFDGIITKPVSHDKLRAVIARAAKSIRP